MASPSEKCSGSLGLLQKLIDAPDMPSVEAVNSSETEIRAKIENVRRFLASVCGLEDQVKKGAEAMLAALQSQLKLAAARGKVSSASFRYVNLDAFSEVFDNFQPRLMIFNLDKPTMQLSYGIRRDSYSNTERESRQTSPGIPAEIRDRFKPTYKMLKTIYDKNGGVASGSAGKAKLVYVFSGGIPPAIREMIAAARSAFVSVHIVVEVPEGYVPDGKHSMHVPLAMVVGYLDGALWLIGSFKPLSLMEVLKEMEADGTSVDSKPCRR